MAGTVHKLDLTFEVFAWKNVPPVHQPGKGHDVQHDTTSDASPTCLPTSDWAPTERQNGPRGCYVPWFHQFHQALPIKIQVAVTKGSVAFKTTTGYVDH